MNFGSAENGADRRPADPSSKQRNLAPHFPLEILQFLKNLCSRCGAVLLFGSAELKGGHQ